MRNDALLLLLASLVVGCGASSDGNSGAQSCAATYTCSFHGTASYGDVNSEKTIDVVDKGDSCALSEVGVEYKNDGTVTSGGSVVPGLRWRGDHQAFTISGSGDGVTLEISCKWLHDAPPPEPTVTCVEFYTYDNVCSSTTGGHHESVRCDDNVRTSDCQSRNNDTVNEYCSTFMSWRDDAFTSKTCADLGYEPGVSKDL